MVQEVKQNIKVPVYDLRKHKETCLTAVQVSDITVDIEPRLTSYQNMRQLIKNLDLVDSAEEKLYMVTSNTQGLDMKISHVSSGTATKSLFNPKGVLQRMLLLGSYRLMLVHNHPSGNLRPSKDDEDMTKLLSLTLDALDCELADHIIVGDKRCYSMMEKEEFDL